MSNIQPTNSLVDLHELTWRDKAHWLIASMCLSSYNQVNRLSTGRLRRKHVPYSVPSLAQEFVRCLNANDELAAKSLFIRLAFSPEMVND